MRIADILDILIIAVCLYFILLWLRRRASLSVVTGLACIGLVYLLAHKLNMYLTSLLFQAGLTAVLLAAVLIFQEDIRRAFEQLASWRLFSRKEPREPMTDAVDILVEAVSTLARERTGALIVLRGRESLEGQVRGGAVLNGRMSMPLICSIFNTDSLTHDGAILVDGVTIEKFGVYLPLSTTVSETGVAGTRHSAALGLSEHSDALVVVVSEERGTISVGFQGKLEIVKSAADLKTRVETFYRDTFPANVHSARTRWITQNPGLKAVSLAAAFLLWVFLAYRGETISRTFTVPIEYRNLPENWMIEEPAPAEARVSLYGSKRALEFDPGAMAVSIDLSRVREGSQDFAVTQESLIKPEGLKVKQIVPAQVRLNAYETADIEVPIRAQTMGSAARGFELSKIKTDPRAVKLRVRKSKQPYITEISTEAVHLDNADRDTTVRAALVIPSSCRFLGQGDAVARVTVSVEKTKRDR